MSMNQYVDAFTSYLRSGDASEIGCFCENAEHIKRLAVYRNGFYKGCVDALAANFPMCQKLLGSENFRSLVRLYVDRYPPEQGTLVGYGLSFPGFIEDLIADLSINEAPVKEASVKETAVKTAAVKQVTNYTDTTELPLNLPDIARLDYAWLTSLMSADSSITLTTEYVTRLMEEGHDLTQVCVKLNASVFLLRVSSGSLPEWISLKTNRTEAQAKEGSTVNSVMFWRVQGAVQARSLSIAEVALMQALQGEFKPLNEAFDAALAVDENFEVSDVFSACLQNELLDIEML